MDWATIINAFVERRMGLLLEGVCRILLLKEGDCKKCKGRIKM